MANVRAQTGPEQFEIGAIPIPMEHPFGEEPFWGTNTLYNHLTHIFNCSGCDKGKQNCSGNYYTYNRIQVNQDWQVVVNGRTYDKSYTIAYYVWYFEGYEEDNGHTLDYSHNCHGYAFDVGDWPEDGDRGTDILLNSGTCYSQQYIVNADIVMLTGHTHSMVATGGMCFNPYTAWEIYTNTAEKFRESDVYRQSGGCGQGVDPLNAHRKPPTNATGKENWTNLQ